jgi:hypothetical protein
MTGLLVRVMQVGSTGSTYTLWVTVADSTKDAIAAVTKAAEAQGIAVFEIGVLRHPVSDETVERLGLGPGQVWRL